MIGFQEASPLKGALIALVFMTQAAVAQEGEPVSGEADQWQQAAAPDAEDSTATADSASDEFASSEVVALEIEEAAIIPIVDIGGADAQPAAPEKSEEPEPARLDDVIVTSTKREKSLREIPQSISSFSGEELETQGKISLADYLEKSPGVVMNTIAPGLVRITIRGIGVETNSLSGQPSPTGIFINDTAFTDPYINGVQPDLSAFDLSSVELLKGPQGTLFGGAALSGAVRYILQEPMLGEWQAKGFTQYVSPKEGSVAISNGVTLNVPLYQHSLAVRLGYVNRKYPGVTDITRNPRQEDVDKGAGEQFRGLLTWQPLDELSVKFVHLTQDYFTPNASTLAVDRENRENNTRIMPQPVRNDFGMNTLTLEYEFESMKVVSLSSRIEKNLSVLGDGTASLIGIPPPGFPAAAGAFTKFDDNSNATSQEFRLQSTSDSDFQWLVGAYLYNYSVFFDLLIDTVAHQTLLGNGSLIDRLLSGLAVDSEALNYETSLFYAVTRTKARERALFADLTYKPIDNLEISAGARFYNTEVKGGFRGVGVVTRAQNNGQAIDYTNNSISEKGINPKLSALYNASEHISVFAQASRGFRFGGLQSVPSTPGNDVPQAYKSDSLWNYELGTRTNWLDNTLRLDLTAFYIVYNDPQISQSTTGVFPLGYTDNVAGAISRGLEFSSRWLTPISGLSLGFDGGLTDAYTTAEFENSDGTIVPEGTQMPGASKSSYAASVAYLRPVGTMQLGATVDYTYVGKGFSDLSGNPDHAINDFGTLNLGITVGSDAWALRPKLALNVSNVLDHAGVKGASTTNPLTQLPAYTSYLLNQPRTFTARLSLEF